MVSLWSEIDHISKNIMSFSLDLIYQSLDDVLSKLKLSIKDMIEHGKDDISIVFFLKYISMPDTMNKLLKKDETRTEILYVYELITSYENQQQIKQLKSVDYANAKIPLPEKSNESFKNFIQEVNQQILIFYFEA